MYTAFRQPTTRRRIEQRFRDLIAVLDRSRTELAGRL